MFLYVQQSFSGAYLNIFHPCLGAGILVQQKVTALCRGLSILSKMFARRKSWSKQRDPSVKYLRDLEALGLLGGSVCCGSDVHGLGRKV